MFANVRYNKNVRSFKVLCVVIYLKKNIIIVGTYLDWKKVRLVHMVRQLDVGQIKCFNKLCMTFLFEVDHLAIASDVVVLIPSHRCQLN